MKAVDIVKEVQLENTGAATECGGVNEANQQLEARNYVPNKQSRAGTHMDYQHQEDEVVVDNQQSENGIHVPTQQQEGELDGAYQHQQDEVVVDNHQQEENDIHAPNQQQEGVVDRG
ncbi:hypothetical protein ACH5RR_039370 [Cinchona calisaya]|uniref:Uncharacterized protein n=1 Tax=Cinchona calisaya TaxID=153742 RepID=A0ABD2XY10_9GENT